MHVIAQFVRDTVVVFLTVLGGIVVSFVVSVLVSPALLDWYEAYRGNLPYEGALRISFVLSILVFMLGWGVLILRRWTRERAMTWVCMAIACVAVVAVLLLDTTHRLQEEFAWIRYTTAAALVLAGVGSVMSGWWYSKHSQDHPVLRWLWWWLAFIFLYAAGDEVFEIHEAIGVWLERTFSFDHAIGDYVTMGYAIVGFVFLLFFIRVLFREYIPRHTRPVQLLFLGSIFYFVSTLFDTVDGWVHGALVQLGVRLTETGSFVFSDLWYPLFAPRQLLNSLEELFENIAAAAFATAVLILVYEQYGVPSSETAERSFRWSARVSAFVVIGGIGALLVWARPSFTIASPVIGMQARAVATPTSHGLFHTDALVAHESWGVLIGNEGGGNVVSLFDRAMQSALDQDRGMVNVDGLAATTDAIYASDPVRRAVFRYTKNNGWEEFLTRNDGMREPEGLTVVGETLYIIDESERTISAVDINTRRVQSMKLVHPKLVAPEGIAYHPTLDRLLITDDVTGYIFALQFGGNLTVFAGPDARLRNPEEITISKEGHIFVTDNGTREIVEFTPDGAVVRRIRFRRMYRDLHGIAVVGGGSTQKIYVVTADGYGSTSFMPSIVWEFE